MNNAYTAGIIDGEGCLGFQAGAARNYARITVSNTSLDLVEFLKKAYGGWIHKRTDRKPGYRQVYQWGLTSKQDILSFLNAVRPYLIVKRDQADLLLTCIARGDKMKR